MEKKTVKIGADLHQYIKKICKENKKPMGKNIEGILAQYINFAIQAFEANQEMKNKDK